MLGQPLLLRIGVLGVEKKGAIGANDAMRSADSIRWTTRDKQTLFAAVEARARYYGAIAGSGKIGFENGVAARMSQPAQPFKRGAARPGRYPYVPGCLS